MSPTMLRPGARALGALLVSAALVGVPSAASADETPSATPTATATATPTGEPSAEASPSATATPSAEPSATTTPTPTDSPAPSPSAATPSASPSSTASTSEEPAAGLVRGGDARRYGLAAADGPTTSTDPVLVGANFLEEQLRPKHYFSYDGFDFPSYGATADAVLALDAAGTGQDEAALATAYLADHVNDYVGVAYSGRAGEVASGPTAKLLNVAVAQGADPTAFGGVDLVATLEGREQPNGRYTDLTLDFTTGDPLTEDYSNMFGQSLAVIGLHRAGAGPSAAAVDFLVTQQCPGGGFQLYMSDAGCTSDTDADPDATAMAVQALLAVGGHSAEAGDGLDYLAGVQRSDGGVGGTGPTSAPNANSTGLAGQAFLAGGRTAQARLAQEYLTDLQLGCDVPAALRGAVAYDQARYDAVTDDPSSATATDQDRRATAQALLALAGVPLGSVTATGSTAEAPALSCTTSSPTPTDDGSGSGGGSGTPGSGGSATGGPGATTPAATAAPVSGPTGALAQTGASPLLPVLVGLALVLVGGLAVYGSRRRGAHA